VIVSTSNRRIVKREAIIVNRAIVIWTSNGSVSSSNRIVRTDGGITLTEALRIMPCTSLEIPGTEQIFTFDVPEIPVDGISRPSTVQGMRAPELLLRRVVLKIPADVQMMTDDVQGMTSNALDRHVDELTRTADLPEIRSGVLVCIAHLLKIPSCLLVCIDDVLNVPPSVLIGIADLHVTPSPFTVCNADFLKIPTALLVCIADVLRIPSPLPPAMNRQRAIASQVPRAAASTSTAMPITRAGDADGRGGVRAGSGGCGLAAGSNARRASMAPRGAPSPFAASTCSKIGRSRSATRARYRRRPSSIAAVRSCPAAMASWL